MIKSSTDVDSKIITIMVEEGQLVLETEEIQETIFNR